MHNSLNFSWYHFTQLTTDLLYEILAFRQSIFVVEQNCPYVDADGLDQHAWHLLGRDSTGKLIAYLRLVEPESKYPEPSIGRVLTRAENRRQGIGLDLIQEGLRKSQELFPGQRNRISAQAYLQGFYEACGYRRVSEPYAEDGIPHIEMVWKSK